MKVQENSSLAVATFQGGIVTLEIPKGAKISKAKQSNKRGKVIGFSKKSRKRLLDVTARLADSRAIFVTLTYGQQFPDCMEAKQHLQNFLKRFTRQYPNVTAMWRLELQSRLAPHFHLMLFCKFVPKAWIASNWGAVIGKQHWDLSGDVARLPFIRVEKIHNRKHLRRYISKYVAKTTIVDGEGDGIARFNAMPYPTETTQETTQAQTVGRVWGIWNREFMPFADCYTATIPVESVDSQFWNLKRLARKVWKGINKSRRGFTLYVEDALQWFNYCIYLDGGNRNNGLQFQQVNT